MIEQQKNPMTISLKFDDDKRNMKDWYKNVRQNNES